MEFDNELAKLISFWREDAPYQNVTDASGRLFHSGLQLVDQAIPTT
jgi:hypothetical protein